MIDFTITEISKAGNLYCALLFFFILAIYWNRCVSQVALRNPQRTPLLFFLVTLFAVTAWCFGDFFGYMANSESYYKGIEYFHLEKVYEYIINITGANYLLFRIVVWGGAMICYYYTAKILKLNTTLSIFVLFLLYIHIFSYARVSLAMAIYFLGVAILGKGVESRKSLLFIIGSLLIISSYIFHKSMAAVIILTAFFFVPINKKNILFIVLIVSVLGFAIDQLMDSFAMSLLGIGDKQLSNKIEHMYEYEKVRSGFSGSIWGWIMLIWQYVPFYLTFIFVSITMLGKDRLSIPKSINGLYHITFSIVALATSVLIFSNRSMTLFYRYLYMSFIPLSLLVVYLYTHGFFNTSRYKNIIYICGGYNIFYFFMHLF